LLGTVLGEYRPSVFAKGTHKGRELSRDIANVDYNYYYIRSSEFFRAVRLRLVKSENPAEKASVALNLFHPSQRRTSVPIIETEARNRLVSLNATLLTFTKKIITKTPFHATTLGFDNL